MMGDNAGCLHSVQRQPSRAVKQQQCSRCSPERHATRPTPVGTYLQLGTVARRYADSAVLRNTTRTVRAASVDV